MRLEVAVDYIIAVEERVARQTGRYLSCRPKGSTRYADQLGSLNSHCTCREEADQRVGLSDSGKRAPFQSVRQTFPGVVLSFDYPQP